jgi:hypothetical protein
VGELFGGCALLDAVVSRDLKENAESGHADRCGSNRQKNVQRRLRAAQPILPRFEIPRAPIAKRWPIVVASACFTRTSDLRQNELQRHHDEDESADDDEQIIR